jgi:hypothetical protein
MKEKSIKKALKEVLVVVSGIPRSGTSLMMQMLQAGGVKILSDRKRVADRNNPKGYLELEAVKKLSKDNSCLKGQKGKAVKVISHLLKHLPGGQQYKVIFMNRHINEVIKSQQKMLGKIEKKYPKALMKAFDKEATRVKEWARAQPNIKLLDMNYSDIIENPSREVDKILSFLDAPLYKEKMIEVIDPSLYRSKIEQKI